MSIHLSSQSKSSLAPSQAPVRKILMQCRNAFWFAFALTFIIDLLSITPLMYMMNTMDRVLSSKSGVTLVSLTVIVIAFYVFWSALEWIRARLLVRLSLRIDWELAADVFDASFRRYVGRKNVNVHQLLADLLALRQFFTGQPVMSLMDAPFAIVFIAIGALFHPYLAIFAAVSSVLMIAVSYFTIKITSPILKEAQDANTEASRVAANSLRHAESTMALGMLGAVRNRWYAQHRHFLTNQVNASEATGLMGGMSGFLQKAMPSLQMALGTFLAMEGLITGGMIMVASMLISKAVSPIQKLIGNWKDIVAARQAYERLNELLAEDQQRGKTMQLPPPQGRLEVKGATAVPPGHNKAVLVDMSFALTPGQVLAVVGPSAAGKSSLVKMLLGVWKPAQGHVRLDGVEISEWSHDEVGPLVGYVPQEIEFFDGTVAENIARLGEVDAAKVVQAAQLIGMHDSILAFPKGYDTPLGETGFALSGGQRQRIAIARAVYGMPKYVVMDEPNSNLDEVGENALISAVQALGYATYTPPDYLPPTPKRKSDVPVVFSNPAKVSRAFLAELQAMPGKKCFVHRQFQYPQARARVEEALGAANVEFVLPTSHKEALEVLGQHKVMLDTFPYSSGLTAREALAMGVKVQAKVGTLFCERHCAGI